MLIGFFFTGCAGNHAAKTPAPHDALGPGGIMNPKLARHVDWLLQKINATETQRKKIKTDLNNLMLEMGRISKDYKDLTSQLVQTFAKEDADRSTFESIRSDRIEQFDAASRRMADAVFGIYNTLTPEQRKEVAELWEKAER